MSIPIITLFKTFDATKDFTVIFSYNGSQVFENQITVRDNVTNVVIYQHKVESLQLNAIIPADTLTNGTQYNCYINVFDEDGKISDNSETVVFTCHKTPIISIDVSANQIIKNSYLTVNVSYTTVDNELLNYWKLRLYDSGDVLIRETDEFLATQTMQTIINGLENNASYRLEVIGTTVDNMEVSTGKIPIAVTYKQPDIFNKLELINLPEDGEIKVDSHLIAIEGKSLPSPPSYINNTEIDLSKYCKYILDDHDYATNGNSVNISIVGYKGIVNQCCATARLPQKMNMSPDNPISIRGVNSVTIDNAVNVDAKNLLSNSADCVVNANNANYTRFDITNIPLNKGTTYTFSIDKVKCLSGTATQVTVDLYDYSLTTLKKEFTFDVLKSKQEQSWTCDVDDVATVLLYAGVKGNELGNQIEYVRFKLEKGSKSTDWFLQPKSQIIQLSAPLYELPDGTSDTLDLMTGKEVQKLNALTFNGNTDEIWSYRNDISGLTNTACFTTGKDGLVDSWPLCSHFPTREGIDDVEHINPIVSGDGYNIEIFINTSRLSSWNNSGTSAQKIQAFKTWLSNNPITVVYALAKSQIINYNVAFTELYNPYTHLSCTNNGNIYIYYSVIDYISAGNVEFDNDYTIVNDSTIQILLRHVYPYTVCFYGTNGNEYFTVRYIISTFDEGIKGYFLLEVYNKIYSTRCASELINPVDDNQYVYLFIRHDNGLWSIHVQLKS